METGLIKEAGTLQPDSQSQRPEPVLIRGRKRDGQAHCGQKVRGIFPRRLMKRQAQRAIHDDIRDTEPEAHSGSWGVVTRNAS